AGLLALASVLGVGEGHLLHRETRWVGSRYFAKSESLFQSFLKKKWCHYEKNRRVSSEEIVRDVS
ncbi:hypothetical protein KEM07_26200, partial [Pseudomonas carnis]|uniref:hypothetical protein n=1 Tax=Pseudomonas carnis TaxID=2487355 RepID=UPI001C308AFE